MDFIFKKTSEIANGIMDLAEFVGKRLEGSRSLVNPGDLVGTAAEVTVPIGKNSVGEIVAVVDGTRINYPARARDRNASFDKGANVRIALAGSANVFVESIDCSTGLPEKSTSSASSKKRASKKSPLKKTTASKSTG